MIVASKAEASAFRFAAEGGEPSNPRRLNFYGHFRRGKQAKVWRAGLIEKYGPRWRTLK